MDGYSARYEGKRAFELGAMGYFGTIGIRHRRALGRPAKSEAMISFDTRILAITAIVIAALLGGWYYGQRQYQAGQAEATHRYTASISAIKAEAVKILAAETAKNRATEQALHAALDKQNTKDSTNEKTIFALSGRLRNLTDSAGRLRDPHAPGCGPCSSGPPSEAAADTVAGAADTAPASWALSKQLTEFLFQQAADADTLNAAYASCRADAYAARGESTP